MDATLYWNAVLLEASRRDFTRGDSNGQQPGPIRTSYAMAIVHIAIHDAVAFHTNLPGAAYMTKKGFAHGLTPLPGGDLPSKIAGAAITTLKKLYPKFTLYFEDSLGPVNDASFAFGVAVGEAVLKMRWGPSMVQDSTAADHSTDMIMGPQPANPLYGQHRADPYQPGQMQLGPKWGDVDTFLDPPPPGSPKNRPLGPPPGMSPDYLADPDYRARFEEVRDLGSVTRGARTAEQQRIGVYWGYDGANNLGVPPRLYNQIVRKIVTDRMKPPAPPMTQAQIAELFAIVNVAMAEAGIDAWHHKYHYNLWRPVVGIRAEDARRGGDPFWAPLGAPTTNIPGRMTQTPPFPAYPSGHATFGAALFQSLRLSLKTAPALEAAEVMAFDNGTGATVAGETFEFVSDELDGVAADPDGSSRTRVVKLFASFAEALWENAVARVYLGVHWRFDGLPEKPGDNVGGVQLGLKIGEDAHTFFNKAPSLSGSA